MIKVCPICGEEYLAKRKEQIFCSVNCRRINTRKKIKVFCETCKKEFFKFPKEVNKTKHNFCSKECFDKYQKKQSEYEIFDDYAVIIINSPKYGKKIVLIDIEDIEKVKGYSWCLRKNGDDFYVQSHVFVAPNKRKNIQIHRVIMNCPDAKVIDHINHNTLDNRKQNLRICTIAENNRNKKSKV